MDLAEYKRMQEETELFRNNLEAVSAERMALDRQYLRKIQESIALETESVKKDVEIQKLKKETDSLKSQLASMRAQMAEKEISEVVPESCL